MASDGITATETTISLGESTTINATAIAVATKWYVYEDSTSSTPLASGNGATLSYEYTPTTTGEHTIYAVFVGTDKTGKETVKATRNILITVNPPLPLVNSTVNVDDGLAVLQVLETLQPGTYTIRGTYNENAHYQSGTDTGTLILIQKKNVSCTFVNGPTEGYTGDSMTLRAKVQESSTSLPVTSGTVTFYVDGVPTVFNQTLDSSGECTTQLTLTSSGTHTYYFVYNGTNEYNTSQSGTLTVNVTDPPVTTSALFTIAGPETFDHDSESGALLFSIPINETDIEVFGDLSETDGNGGWSGDYLNDNYNGAFFLATEDTVLSIRISMDGNSQLMGEIIYDLNGYLQSGMVTFMEYGGESEVSDGDVVLVYDISEGEFNITWISEVAQSDTVGYLILLEAWDDAGPRIIWNEDFVSITGVDPSNYLEE